MPEIEISVCSSNSAIVWAAGLTARTLRERVKKIRHTTEAVELRRVPQLAQLVVLLFGTAARRTVLEVKLCRRETADGAYIVGLRFRSFQLRQFIQRLGKERGVFGFCRFGVVEIPDRICEPSRARLLQEFRIHRVPLVRLALDRRFQVVPCGFHYRLVKLRLRLSSKLTEDRRVVRCMNLLGP